MRRLALLACTLILALAPLPALALQKSTSCVCMEAPLKYRWDHTQAAFTGTVTDIEEVKEWVQRGSADLPIIVTITVTEGFKGLEKGNIFKFHTSMHRDTCMGADYEKGKEYLFFAYMRTPETYEKWSLYDFPSGTYDVGGFCGGTKTMDNPLTAPEIVEIKKLLPSDAPMLEAKDGIYGLPPEKKVAVPTDE